MLCVCFVERGCCVFVCVCVCVLWRMDVYVGMYVCMCRWEGECCCVWGGIDNTLLYAHTLTHNICVLKHHHHHRGAVDS